MAGIPKPKDGFLAKQDSLGFRNGQQVWRSKDQSQLYTWDSLHGEVEVFNTRGKHLGVLNGETGAMIKPAVKGRKIDV